MTANEHSPLLGSREPSVGGTQSPDSRIKDPESQRNGQLNDHDEQSEEQDADPDQPRIPGVSLKYIVPVMAVGIFLAAMDNTIVVASYGRVGTELDALDRTSWISTGYLLTTTAMQPLYGKLSDIFGRKSCLLFAYSVFGIGCLLCGMSQTMGQLILARAFAGIGGGGMTTVTSILLSDIVSLRKRGTWQGILNIVFATGAAAGGPLGGYLADTVGWRWAFLGQFPITVLAVLIVTFGLNLPSHEPKRLIEGEEDVTPSQATKHKLRRIDFPGAFTLVAAIFTLLVSLDQSTSTVKLPLHSLIVLSITSLMLWCLFAVIESFPSISKEPFCPSRLVIQRGILSPCLANFFSFMAVYTVIFNFPLYCQAVLETSASTAGKRLLPAILGGMVGSLLGGIYMQKTGKYYTLTAVASFGLFLACALQAVVVSLPDLDVTFKIYALGTCLALIALGNGVVVTSTLIALISNVTAEDQAIVTAISYLFRSLGMVLGVGISAGIMQSGLARALHQKLDHGKYGNPEKVEKIINGVRRGLDYLNGLEPGLAKVIRRCYEESIAEAFYFSVAITFLAFIASLGLNEVKVKRK